MEPVRPGIHTTEFWLAAIGPLLTVLLTFGFISATDKPTLEDALTKGILGLGALVAQAWVIVNYIQGRVAEKTNPPVVEPPVEPPAVIAPHDEYGRPMVGPAIAFLALGLLLWTAIPSQAQQRLPAKPVQQKNTACLFGNGNAVTLERLRTLEKQQDRILDQVQQLQQPQLQPQPQPYIYQQQQPIPPSYGSQQPGSQMQYMHLIIQLPPSNGGQAPANPPIVIPPSNIVVPPPSPPSPPTPPAPQTPAPTPAPIIIQGGPQQQIPLGGAPKQDIPLGGAPKQDIPLGGGPKIEIPLGGAPKIDIPLGGGPKIEIPLGGTPPKQMEKVPDGNGQPKQQIPQDSGPRLQIPIATPPMGTSARGTTQAPAGYLRVYDSRSGQYRTQPQQQQPSYQRGYYPTVKQASNQQSTTWVQPAWRPAK